MKHLLRGCLSEMPLAFLEIPAAILILALFGGQKVEIPMWTGVDLPLIATFLFVLLYGVATNYPIKTRKEIRVPKGRGIGFVAFALFTRAVMHGVLEEVADRWLTPLAFFSLLQLVGVKSFWVAVLIALVYFAMGHRYGHGGFERVANAFFIGALCWVVVLNYGLINAMILHTLLDLGAEISRFIRPKIIYL